MKILAVIGSTRNGNTKYVIEKTLQEIQKYEGISIETINLKNIKMNYCNGCLLCDETGQCNIDDDMTKLVDHVKNADAYIFATPTRWRLLSGEMKTFFDRLNPLAVSEALKGKIASIIAIGQSSYEEKDSIVSAANSIMAFCNDAGIEVIDKIIICDCYGNNDIAQKTDDINNCILSGKKLIEANNTRRGKEENEA